MNAVDGPDRIDHIVDIAHNMLAEHNDEPLMAYLTGKHFYLPLDFSVRKNLSLGRCI